MQEDEDPAEDDNPQDDEGTAGRGMDPAEERLHQEAMYREAIDVKREDEAADAASGNPWCISGDACRGTPTSQAVQHYLRKDDWGVLEPRDCYCIECWKHARRYYPYGHLMVCLPVAAAT